MEITRLSVKGYRSLADIEWRPGRLNVLVGPNGSGKTNLLLVLRMLRHAARGELNEFVLRQGGMASIVWDGKAAGIQFDVLTNEASSNSLTIEQKYHLRLSRSKISQYVIESEVLMAVDRESGAHALIERSHETASISSEKPVRKEDRIHVAASETALSLFRTPLASPEIAGIAERLSEWVIHSEFNLQDARRSIIVSPEYLLTNDASNLLQVLHTRYNVDQQFTNDVDLAMAAAFGEDYGNLVFPPVASQRIELSVRWKSLSSLQPSSNFSHGTLRFLALVVALLSARESSVLAVEEPEVALHPSMLGVLAELAAEASQKAQVILTTHSPAFLDALSSHHPVVTTFEWREGQTILRQLEGGALSYWLERYKLGEMFRSGQLETIT